MSGIHPLDMIIDDYPSTPGNHGDIHPSGGLPGSQSDTSIAATYDKVMKAAGPEFHTSQSDTSLSTPKTPRQKLLASFCDVIRLLTDVEAITDVLISRSVFTPEDARRVLNEGTDERKTRELLYILYKKPNEGIVVFMETLEKCNINIYQLIMAARVEDTIPPMSITFTEEETLRVFLGSCVSEYLCADPRGLLELSIILQYLQQQCSNSGLPHVVTYDDVIHTLVNKFKISVCKPKTFTLPTHVAGVSWKPNMLDRIRLRLHSTDFQPSFQPSTFIVENTEDEDMRPRSHSMDIAISLKHARERSRIKSATNELRSHSCNRSTSSKMTLLEPEQPDASKMQIQPYLPDASKMQVPEPPPLPPRRPIFSYQNFTERKSSGTHVNIARNSTSTSVTSDTIQLLAEQLHNMISPMASRLMAVNSFLSRMPLDDRTRVVSELVKGKTALYKAFYIHSYNLMVFLIEECLADVNQMFIPNSYTEHTTILSQAASANRVKDVELVLKHGAIIDKGNTKGSLSILNTMATGNQSKDLCAFRSDRCCIGMTAVMHACCHGHQAMVKFLVTSGAHINIVDEWGRSCLMLASSWPDVLEFLLGLGGEVDDQDMRGNTALHWAIHSSNISSVRLLLQHRIEVNIRNHTGDTALHLAIQADSLVLVKLLLAHGEDMYVRNNSKEDALMVATLNTQPHIIEVLLEHHRKSVIIISPW